jgi:hypothetical protein
MDLTFGQPNGFRLSDLDECGNPEMPKWLICHEVGLHQNALPIGS